jgi:hypothetical protein
MNCAEDRCARDCGCNGCNQECGCNNGCNGTCDGLNSIREGRDNVVQGFRCVETANERVTQALSEVENVLRMLRCCNDELNSACCREAQALREINSGICQIEGDSNSCC